MRTWKYHNYFARVNKLYHKFTIKAKNNGTIGLNNNDCNYNYNHTNDSNVNTNRSTNMTDYSKFHDTTDRGNNGTFTTKWTNIKAVSVSDNPHNKMPWYAHRQSTYVNIRNYNNNNNGDLNANNNNDADDLELGSFSLLTKGTDSIGVCVIAWSTNKCSIKEKIDSELFNSILADVLELDDLRLDVFPRFWGSRY